MTHKALFLDRDGVINKAYLLEGKPYPPSRLEDVVFLEGVKESLALSKKMGFLNIIVTNQPDVATGKQSLDIVNQIHGFIKKSLTVDDIFVCLHSDLDKCSCRKPLPGMLISAREKWQIDFSKSYLVGDRWRDIEAGQAVGCIGFFIDYGYKERRPAPPYHTVVSLEDAVNKMNHLTRLSEGEKKSEFRS
jgi:D-glycero-D-manno-heptose 1,7-bisphosphate phosphatase